LSNDQFDKERIHVIHLSLIRRDLSCSHPLFNSKQVEQAKLLEDNDMDEDGYSTFIDSISTTNDNNDKDEASTSNGKHNNLDLQIRFLISFKRRHTAKTVDFKEVGIECY